MATRRNRIKGIANIPQRRKAENKLSEDSPTLLDTESITAKASVTHNNDKIIEKTELEQPSAQEIKPKAEEHHLHENEKTESTSITKPSTGTANAELPRRRTFIKPIVNLKLLSQKPKLKLELVKREEVKTEKPKAEIVTSDSESALTNQKLVNEDHDNLSTSQPKVQIKPVPILPPESIKSSSDTEYPIGPLSPTKLLNRSRIKAVPRLGQRRTSMTLHGSASESEDDGRKNYKRIRTESTCSTVSVNNEPQLRNEPGSPQKSKEFSSVIQRKCKRTEQSRKMAEARRHFLHKFGNQAPDKQKLTMIDLIFYNPTTNPMCPKLKKQAIEEAEDDDENFDNTETVEEPKPPVDDCVESDEENAIPAPQIKIGANGEIVVDEKSLIIENVETKRGREELQKSKIIDGDFDTGYGIYKREKRSKDWSKEETLRFYKALNTLGPDFSLMVELFAGRSRRELKMKFKKEERVNRPLVDKALTQPVQFDITELRREVEEEQKRKEEEAERRAQKLLSPSKKPIPYYAQRKKRTLGEKQKKVRQVEQKLQDMYSKLEKGIASLYESDAEDEISEKPCSKPHTELKPTRSGRIPKPIQPYDGTLVKKTRPKLKPDNVDQHVHENKFTDLNAIQPGSIMIVTSQTPTGEPTFKVFMVTPTQCKVPITLTPDMLTNLTQSTDNKPSIKEIEENITIPAEENNITIPAEENNITIPAEENNITIPAEENNITIPVDDNDITIAGDENVVITEDVIAEEMWPYEHANISIPVDNIISLPKDEDITLCSDGKYNVELKPESSEETILPD